MRKKKTEEVVMDEKIDKIVDAVVDSPKVDKLLDEIVEEAVGSTVDELSSPKVIPVNGSKIDATVRELALPEVDKFLPVVATQKEVEEYLGRATLTPELKEEPTATNLAPVEIVKINSELVTVNKKALYRLVQALNRNQVHMYIGTAATRFLGDLFGLDTLIARTAKWEEVKKWNEENR